MICSDEFGPLGRAEAQVLGMGGLPLLPIPHPLAGNDGALVRAKAEAIADEVLSALTDAPAAENSVPVTLTEVAFEGNFISVHAVTENGTDLVAELRNDGQASPITGAKMYLSFEARNASLLPDSTTTGA